MAKRQDSYTGKRIEAMRLHGWWKLIVNECGFVWERRVCHVCATAGAGMGNEGMGRESWIVGEWISMATDHVAMWFFVRSVRPAGFVGCEGNMRTGQMKRPTLIKEKMDAAELNMDTQHANKTHDITCRTFLSIANPSRGFPVVASQGSASVPHCFPRSFHRSSLRFF